MVKDLCCGVLQFAQPHCLMPQTKWDMDICANYYRSETKGRNQSLNNHWKNYHRLLSVSQEEGRDCSVEVAVGSLSASPPIGKGMESSGKRVASARRFQGCDTTTVNNCIIQAEAFDSGYCSMKFILSLIFFCL